MANTQQSPEPTQHTNPNQAETPTGEVTPEEDEFKITVKKLDVVVRPRGVLAE
jgi:hypothetical protein